MPDQKRLTPEMLVPRMGEYLVQKGLITTEALQKALDHQQEETAKGHMILLGQALVDLDLLSRTELDQAVTEQIIQLRSALQAANRTLERRVEERTAELQKALERVSELSQLKANFISNISHELRTPLTHMKGYIELLITESLGSITEEQRHALAVAQQSTNKLETLVDDLIMVSLASRGEMSLKLENVDIRRLANLSVKSHGEAALKRGVHLHTVIDEDVPFVQGDPQKIAWVLGQLIDNGIKFTPSAGSVVVSIKCEGENLVIVSVTDTGIGIPSSRMQDIFEPFHQLDGSTTRHYSGTGLGLSLVRQIIEAHGSMLEVQSTEGRGTSFKFPLLAVLEAR
ncbi:MAG TPA: HAMP domain-containing sensor histidine kinase [Anaerolineales bacterium]|nr:HAMP domain-containing sensor histidine kinase [Anaerolineales bacterium]